MQVNILEAKNRLSKLIKSVQAGEEVIIANRGEPVARLVAVRPSHSAATGAAAPEGLAKWLRAHPLPAHRQRSHEAIQSDIDKERRAWD